MTTFCSMAYVKLFSHFFSNQTLIDVFLYFILNPTENTYLAQIVQSTDKALIQVQRTVKRLVDCGLLLKSVEHKKTYYKIDTKHVAFDALRQLVIQAKILSVPYKEDLERLQAKVDFAFVYGSVAKGSNTSESDIDLFFVGNLTYNDVSPFIFKLGRELAQEVNATIFTPSMLSQQVTAKNVFVTKVIEEQKIWLFGDKSEFEKIYS